MRRLILGSVMIVVCLPVLGESIILPVGVSGLEKIDFSLSLYECDNSGCTVQDSSAIIVTEMVNGRDYLISDLPDVSPGDDIWYEVTMSPSGSLVRYSYPIQTRTPQSTSSVVSYRIPSVVTLSAGDTLPSVDVTVAGLTSDPTGATVVFDLWEVRSGTQILSDVSATVPDIDANTDGTWSATLRHNWTVDETDELSGAYYGRFEITFSGGGKMTIPPSPNSLRVQVFP